MSNSELTVPQNSGRVPVGTKVLYGLGFASRGINDGLFQVFLFVYFNQVLGLDPSLAGLASGISLIFDAVSDPAIGLMSDKFDSKKWGRRHPFMFVSAVPLALFTYLLFAPPADLSQWGLFTWLLGFNVLIRVALTFFVVPHMSLGAEMSTNYEERTSITSYRIMFSAVITTFVIIFGILVFFPESDGGLQNGDAYPRYAFFCAIMMIVVIWICVWGTRHVIPNLPKASESQRRASLMEMLKSISVAMRMKSFRTLVTFMTFVYTGVGIGVVLTTYFVVYFFEMTSKEFAVLPIANAIGGLIALFVAKWFNRKFDKRQGAMISTFLFGLFFSLPFNLRLLGLFPENGSAALVPTYAIFLSIAYIFFWVALSLGNSMMADVVDESEISTGDRQEGLFFSAMSFAYKCSTGLGGLIAGVLLSTIAFPEKAVVGAVPDGAIFGLGMIGGPLVLIIYVISTILLIAYPINRKRYQEIRTALDER